MGSHSAPSVRRTVTKSLVANTAATPSTASTAAANASSVSSPRVTLIIAGSVRSRVNFIASGFGVVLGSAWAMGQPYAPTVACIRVDTTIDAPPDVVWGAIDDVRTHPRWMEDAVAVRVTSSSSAGVGTTFDCDTKVGPFRLTDKMAITRWEEAVAMGVRHVGLVEGEGEFVLTPLDGDRTRFTWTEELHFPLWMAGPLGAAAGAPVLRRIWRKNLTNLKALVESP